MEAFAPIAVMNTELLLSNISRHISLDAREADYFTALLRHKQVPAGDFLLREGETCRHESFVTSGCLKVYHTDAEGNEHIVDFLVEEWWAQDLYSFFTGKAAATNIRAIEDAELLQISKADLENLYQQVPKFERFFRLLFQKAFIAQKDQIYSILSESASERYAQFLQRKPYAEMRFSQKDIASYLGITPQFLSRLRRKKV